MSGSVTINGTIRGATYGFGGLFIINGVTNVCHTPNPYSNACNCPTGFFAPPVAGALLMTYQCIR